MSLYFNEGLGGGKGLYGHYSGVKMNNDIIMGLNKRISEYKFDRITYKSDLQKIYQDILDEKEEFQNQYDEETDFSRNKEKQAEWLKKIEKMLEDLKQFADYT